MDHITARPRFVCNLSRALAVAVGAPTRCLVRHRYRLAEMGDRLLEGRAAQGLVARLAPPFDREVVEAGLGEVMGDDFGLGRRAFGFVPEDFARSAVERLAAALEKALVGRVLDQRVLEAIGRLRAGALDEQEVRVDKAIERGLQAAVVDRGWTAGSSTPPTGGARARSRA